MILDYNNDIVSVNEQGRSIPEFINLAKHAGASLQKYLLYLYFVYDKRSVYRNVLINDRKKIVCGDRFPDKGMNVWIKIEESSEVKAFIEKINELQFTANERLLIGVERKISEYLQFWDDTAINSSNHKLVSETLQESEKLINMQEKLSKMVKNEIATKQVGGGSSTMFEDGN